MNRREQLRENYEDALFALLMDYVAESEGKKALAENKKLMQDPGAEVPAKVNRACRKVIDQAFRTQRARSVGRVIVRVVRTVAVAALLGVLLLSAAFAASPQFRAGTLNFILDTFNEGVSFDMKKDDTSSVSTFTELEDIKPAWVPEGFELVEEGTFSENAWARYYTEHGDRLFISMTSGGNFDIQNAKPEWTQIQGFPACIIDQIDTDGDSKGSIKIIVVNEREGYILSVRSTPYSTTAPVLIDRDIIIAITESIFE